MNEHEPSATEQIPAQVSTREVRESALEKFAQWPTPVCDQAARREP